jgi:hypothetical protein
MELHTADPLEPERSPSVPEISVAKLKRYKSPGIDRILAELFQAGGEIIILIYNEGGTTGCSNYRGVSLLPTSYTILHNIPP